MTIKSEKEYEAAKREYFALKQLGFLGRAFYSYSYRENPDELESKLQADLENWEAQHRKKENGSLSWKDKLGWLGLSVISLSFFSAIGFNIYNINKARDAFETNARPKIEQVILKASGEDRILSVSEANTLIERLGYEGPPIEPTPEGRPIFDLTLCDRHNNYRILTGTWSRRSTVGRTLVTGRYALDVSPKVIDDYLRE